MGKIKFDEVIKLFSTYNDRFLVHHLLEYAELKEKVERANEQSFYFQMGLENHKKRLRVMKLTFEKTRRYFNHSTLDDLISKSASIKETMEIKKAGEFNMISRISYYFLKSDFLYHKQLIKLKSKTSELQSIDYYLEHPEELLKIIE
ncbi:hypothetical protein [Tenuifilum thalassicum]|uniref:Uncharacterized protein n=1 Tax=Tenuifilum thalassicum TaxID=2590900 RepID=A0A7D3XJQ1_9BACT|nr:hypothetical protein [Tenuifilum thalassicum]QKG78775.1 hypothetical protein FHG85_00315 [Tenuifilum thalassicum]